MNEALDLLVLGLHLAMPGEGLYRTRAAPSPICENILMNVQVTGGLCRRHPALADQPDRLDLELSAKLTSLHHPPPGL
jgi:hypothetical protein